MSTYIARILVLIMVSTVIGQAQGQELCIYVSDAGNFDSPPSQILKFDQDGSNPEVFIDENLAWPQDILFLEVGIIILQGSKTIRDVDARGRNGSSRDLFA